MKKLLLISLLILFAIGGMFAQATISVTVNGETTSRTGGTLADILAQEPAIPVTNVTSLTFKEITAGTNSGLKDGDIATLRTCTNMTTLDMEHVKLVPVGTGEPLVPTNPFIEVSDTAYTTELAPNGFNDAVKCGITQATQLPSHIFDKMTNLQTVTIPSSVTTFGDYCFRNCESLEEVKNISQVTDLGYHTFHWCTALESFDIPSSVTALNATFHGCAQLTSVTFPSGLTTINDNAFAFCYSFDLNDGAIPASVTTIGDYAFFKCENLTKIVLPSAGLTKLGGYAFEYDSKLVTVENFDMIHLTESQTIELKNQETYDHTHNTTQTRMVNQYIPPYLFKDCTSLKNISFPTDVEAVGGYAFANCSEIVSDFTLSEGLVLLGYEAFNNCKGITFKAEEGKSLLPTSLVSIANEAFRGCTGLSGDITIPDQSDHRISEFAFYGTSITSVTIPEGTKDVGGHAFETANLGAGHTNYILELPATIDFVGAGAFAHGDDNADTNNNQGITSIVFKGTPGSPAASAADGRYVTIDQWAFSDLDNVTEVTFQDGIGVVSTGYFSFNSNEKLETVNIPENAYLSVGNRCFTHNTALTDINLGTNAKVTTIEEYGFQECTSLSSAEVNEILSGLTGTSIAEGAFVNCQNLKELVIPSSIEKIGKLAFGGAGDLRVQLTKITVSRADAPECLYETDATTGNIINDPFNGTTNTNQCQIVFEVPSGTNKADMIDSYRDDNVFLRLLTKTLNQDVETIDWVTQEGADVLLLRNFANTWSSLLLPFSYTKAQKDAVLGEETRHAYFTAFYEASDEVVFRFNTIRDDAVVPANKPALVKVTTTTMPEGGYHFENVDIVEPTIVTYGDGKYLFNGTYVKEENVVPNKSYFPLNNCFQYGGDHRNHSRGFRAWLEPVTTTPAPGFAPSMKQLIPMELDGVNEITAINTINGEVVEINNEAAAQAYYSLDGRRVEHPTNGIYIVNGKKVYVK